MRIILLAVVVTFGTVIGVNAIDNVSKMQDAKMTRILQIVHLMMQEMCNKLIVSMKTTVVQLIRFKLQ